MLSGPRGLHVSIPASSLFEDASSLFMLTPTGARALILEMVTDCV